MSGAEKCSWGCTPGWSKKCISVGGDPNGVCVCECHHDPKYRDPAPTPPQVAEDRLCVTCLHIEGLHRAHANEPACYKRPECGCRGFVADVPPAPARYDCGCHTANNGECKYPDATDKIWNLESDVATLVSQLAAAQWSLKVAQWSLKVEQENHNATGKGWEDAEDMFSRRLRALEAELEKAKQRYDANAEIADLKSDLAAERKSYTDALEKILNRESDQCREHLLYAKRLEDQLSAAKEELERARTSMSAELQNAIENFNASKQERENRIATLEAALQDAREKAIEECIMAVQAKDSEVWGDEDYVSAIRALSTPAQGKGDR